MSATETNNAFDEAFEALAGVNLADIAEVRFESLPPMKAGFEIIEVKPGKADTKKGASLTVNIKCKVLELKSVMSAAHQTPEAQATLIGKTHTETFFILQADALAGLGRLKAFLVDIGIPNPNMPMGEVLKGGILGHKFYGQVKHRVNPEDKDRPFVNVNPIVEKKSMLQVAV